ncbi:MAG: LamB/YcsF family protein [Fibrobacteres bacterium]|nr:LamB/YcsF family protein [Fibrobacterota bacterium]
MLLNCDIGERGADNQVDLEIIRYIDIANIACGGHAGDKESVETFRKLALDNKITLCAHLSYPDKENFGRLSMKIPKNILAKSLLTQRKLLPEAKVVKLHGALYNDTAASPLLAAVAAQIIFDLGFKTAITLKPSPFSLECEKLGIKTLAEGFAERRFTIDPHSGFVKLLSREFPNAVIEDISEAISQCKILEEHFKSDTICVHSDSRIALPLIKEMRKLFPKIPHED